MLYREDRSYDYKSGLVGMNSKEFGEMYENLHPDVREEFNIFLKKANNIKMDEHIRYLDDSLKLLEKYENAPSTRLINIRGGDIVDSQRLKEIIHKETEIKIKSMQKAQRVTRNHSHGKYKSVA